MGMDCVLHMGQQNLIPLNLRENWTENRKREHNYNLAPHVIQIFICYYIILL
jgi:hypothetical protein